MERLNQAVAEMEEEVGKCTDIEVSTLMVARGRDYGRNCHLVYVICSTI